METQLQELIQKIKNDGVAAAENEAADIVNAAKIEAEKILAEAKEKAQKIVDDAKSESRRTVKSGEEAISQAGRNLLISFRESVTRELSALVNSSVKEAFSSSELCSIIVKSVEALSQNTDAEDISLLLNQSDLKVLENNLVAAFNKKLEGGIMLKASDSFDGGFRVAVNGGSAYYDFSTESVTEMLCNYLNPQIAALLKEAQ